MEIWLEKSRVEAAKIQMVESDDLKGKKQA